MKIGIASRMRVDPLSVKDFFSLIVFWYHVQVWKKRRYGTYVNINYKHNHELTKKGVNTPS